MGPTPGRLDHAEGLAPYGRALRAYHEGEEEARLDLKWDLGAEISVAVSTFFELEEPGPGVEREALARALGRVVDVGAGAGRFAVALKARGQSVVAVDVLPDAVAVLEARGVDAVLADITAGPALARADTVLVMMNGTTHAGTLDGLPRLLVSLDALMLAGGRILLDSTDPAHPAVDWGEADDGRAPGELHLQMGFRGRWGPPLPQLFVGPELLQSVSERIGLSCEVVALDEDGRYLMELRRRMK